MNELVVQAEPSNDRGRPTVFVGRDAELRVLQEVLERALAGAGQLVLVSGEPGIGKTRTTEHLTERARSSGALVLWGNCYEWDGAPAYWPWAQALRAWFRTLDDDALRATLGGQTALVAQIVPELRERLTDLPPLPALEPEARLFRLLAAVAAVIRASTRDRPCVVVLDDIHWADIPSLQLLRYLTQEIRDAPVLLVATYRNAELGRQHPATPILADLAREPHCRRIMLRGLPKPQLARFVALASGRAQSQTLVDAVYAETDGNPFFVTEVVRLLADEGQLSGDTGLTFRRTRVPESVREAVGRRLDRLSADCNRALLVASVIGRDFEVRLLERATGVSALALLETLDEASRAQLIAAAELPGAFRFSHALVQETLYQELSVAERTQLHLAVGQALEADGRRTPPWTELARHFYQASPLSDPRAVVTYAAHAGEAAMEQFAWDAAATWHARALAALDLADPANAARRCALLLTLGEAHARSGPGSGDAPAARESFRHAFELARGSGDADSMAHAAVGFAGLNVVTAFGGALQLRMLEEALAALEPADSPLRVRVLSRLAVDLWNRSTANGARARELADEAVASAIRLGDVAQIGFALWARHYSGWSPDNLNERLEIVERLVAQSAQTSDPVVALWGYVTRALDDLEAADLAGAEQALGMLRHFDERAHIPYVALREAAYRGCLELLTGDYVSAEPQIERARELWSSATARMHQLQPFVLLRDLGRLDELAEEIQLPDSYNQWGVATQAHRMWLALERGRFDAARQDYAALVEDDFARVPFDAYWYGVMAPLAQASIAFADRPRAEQIYALLEPFAGRLALVGILGVGHGPVALHLGQLATLLGRWDDAQARLDQALAHAQRLGLRPYVARTLLAQAELCVARDAPGERVAALSFVERATEAATAIGMLGLLPRITVLRDTLLQRRDDRFGLSARELEVLQLVADGLSDAEIAERLFLSRRTVNSHLTSVYTKLEVSSRTAAVHVAREHGLL